MTTDTAIGRAKREVKAAAAEYEHWLSESPQGQMGIERQQAEIEAEQITALARYAAALDHLIALSRATGAVEMANGIGGCMSCEPDAEACRVQVRHYTSALTRLQQEGNDVVGEG